MFKNVYLRKPAYFILLFFSCTVLLSQSHSDYESAENLYRSKSFDTCLEKLDEILSQYSNYHDSTLAATHKLIGDLHLKKYELAKTIQHYEIADTLYFTLGKRHAPKRLNVVNKIGICYAQQDNLIMTAEYFQTAHDIASSLFEPTDLNMAKAINNLAAVYLYIGDFDQSLQYFEKSASIKKKFAKDNPVPLANTYENIASIYGQVNQMGEAESFLHKAGQLYNMEHKENENALLGFYINMAGFYIENDRVDEAIEQLILAEKLPLKYKADKLNVLLVNKNFGVAYLAKKEYGKALQYFKKAEQQINQYEVGQKDLAIIYTHIASIYTKQDQATDAKYIMGKARNAMSSLYDKAHKNYLELLQQQIFIYFEMEDLRSAKILMEEFDNGLDQRRELGEKDLMYSNLKMDFYAIYLNYYAKLYESKREQVHLDTGIAIAEKAFGYQDRVLASISDKESRLYFFKNAYSNFSTSIFLYLEKYETSGELLFLKKAFQLSEKAKFYSLKEARGLRFPNLEDNIAEDLIVKEKRSNIALSQAVSKYENLLDQQSNPELMLALINAIDSLKQERAQLIDKIKVKSPILSKYLDGYNMIDIPAASKYLRQKNNTYISYFLSGNELLNKNFAFKIDRNGLSYEELSLNQENLDLTIKDLVDGLKYDSNESLKEENYLAFEKPAIALYDLLIAKLDLDAQGGLIFNLHNTLHSIPFEVLKKSSDDSYMIQSRSVSYTSSLSDLVDNHASAYDKNLLICSPAFETGNSLGFKPLDNNKQEVEEIDNIAGYKDAIEINTKSEFIQEIKKNKLNVIHLATHAAANQKRGYKSYLAFGGDSTQLLYSREIYGLPIDANLVVLSACESGDGEIVESQGVLGLSAAFAATNSKSMLASLWSVNDASTRTLMVSYYNYLDQGLDKDKALRQSKLDYLSSVTKSKQHPYYWASFIQMGSIESLQFDRSIDISLLRLSATIFMSLMALLFVGYFAIYLKKRAASN